MKKFKFLSLLTIFAVISSSAFSLILTPAHAAGVSVTVSSPANAEFAALTDTDVSFGYPASSTEFGIGDAITVTISPAVTTAVAACATPTTDADGDTTPDGAFGGYGTTGATYTFTAATTQATTAVSLCLNFQNDTAVGNYSISITDDNDNDFGAALIYVGDDNDVTVTASVTPLLAFAIRNAADTSDTNVCDLGILTTAAVSTCEYRLKVSTNASGGYTVQVTTDGDLDTSGGSTIDPVIENALVSAGSEEYGIAFNGGAATVGTITESGDFNDDDTPLPGVATNLYISDGANQPAATDLVNTALVTHRAAIDSNTNTGNYDQVVTYYVSATF